MRRFKFSRRRNGIAVTELAVVLPFVMFFSIVPIELCTMIHLKQSLSVAAYETAKIATRKKGTYALAEQQYDQLIFDRDINGSSIDFSVAEADLVAGMPLTVTVTAPFSQNCLLGFWYIDKTPQAHVTMLKE
ncbi:MAG: TadE/TadG family type IV pilus assembly protein [Pirellulaceae bacterium]|nr:TadE/TadG family type IV pilus assembly protein [Pirellulaceae bacterium]